MAISSTQASGGVVPVRVRVGTCEVDLDVVTAITPGADGTSTRSLVCENVGIVESREGARPGTVFRHGVPVTWISFDQAGTKPSDPRPKHASVYSHGASPHRGTTSVDADALELAVVRAVHEVYASGAWMLGRQSEESCDA
jgi:hypothetical protein